ncbi:MAG: DNA integrity scanning protein DisA nucleotide-binding domain protein [Elusimicrobiota bacterium]
MKEEKKLLNEICTNKRNINLQTLYHVISLAVEIAREGREGRKVGTMFVVSDEEKTLKKSRCLILDPLIGHPDNKKSILDADLRETVKELSQLDGAFIVSDAGIVISACRYIDASSKDLNIPLGLGSRHMAAASITKNTNSVAVIVSESSIVRVIDDGYIVSEIIPEIWMLEQSSLHLEGPYSEQKGEHMTVISKKQ